MTAKQAYNYLMSLQEGQQVKIKTPEQLEMIKEVMEAERRFKGYTTLDIVDEGGDGFDLVKLAGKVEEMEKKYNEI